MGGWVPLGYDADGRTLMINEAEAETVRQLFRLYLDLGTVAAVEEEAKRRGLLTKRYVARNGRQTGGLPFSRGHLYKILSNPLYIGEIAHRDRRYGGQHPAIVDWATWDAVQAQLKSHTHERQVRSKASEPNLLAGLLVDEKGGKFTSTHAVRNGKRYRYYVGPQSGARGAVRRLPAHEVEARVTGELAAFLSDQRRLAQALGPWRPSPDHLESAFHAGEVLSQKLVGSNAGRLEAVVQAVARVQAHSCLVRGACDGAGHNHRRDRRSRGRYGPICQLALEAGVSAARDCGRLLGRRLYAVLGCRADQLGSSPSPLEGYSSMLTGAFRPSHMVKLPLPTARSGRSLAGASVSNPSPNDPLSQ
jgi:hypothetical protein